MNGLAEAALDYFIAFLFPAPGIDGELAESVWQSFPQYTGAMDASQRAALSTAARDRLTLLNSGPDEYGYDPGAQIPDGLPDFLELVATGQIFEQWGSA